MTKGYAVVGGGIVGASIAFHLSKRTDAPVTVYERDELASGTTAASMAMLGRTGDALMTRMKTEAIATYNAFLNDPIGDPEFRPIGTVTVSDTPDGAAALAERVGKGASDADDANEPRAYYEGETLADSMVFPGLETESVEGALHDPGKGYTTPRELAREFAVRARWNGADIKTGTEVNEIVVEDGTARGVVVNGALQPSDAVVCAAGPWNVELLQRAGLDLPVRHSLAPILELNPSEEFARPLPYTKHQESGIYARGTPDRTVLVGRHTTEAVPFDEVERYDPDEVGNSVPDAFREDVLAFAESFLPSLTNAEEVGERVAIGSRTPDARPLLGRTHVDGLAVACFHSQGIQLAPAAGRIIAGQLVGDGTEYDDAVSPSRFA